MSKETRWDVDFRVVSNHPTSFYIQTKINDSWFTLSSMTDNNMSYHFNSYRGFYSTKDLLTWYSKTYIRNITRNSMWMPSNALQDIEVVTTKSELINLYPEVLI